MIMSSSHGKMPGKSVPPEMREGENERKGPSDICEMASAGEDRRKKPQISQIVNLRFLIYYF